MIDVPVVADSPETRESLIHRHNVSWQEYHSFRNDILRALRPLGTVDPMGEAPITNEEDGPPDGWPVEELAPQFLVVDDQWHDDQLSTKVECDPPSVSMDLMEALLVLAAKWKGSTIVVAVSENGGFVVGDGRVLIAGPLLSGACSAAELVDRCSHRAPSDR